MAVRRIVVSSAGRSRGTGSSFAFDIQKHLNLFAGKTVRFALEWTTPVQSSDAGDGFPLSVLLVCSSFTQINQQKTFENNNDSVLALLQGYEGTGVYGHTADTPYVQTTACGGLCLGDQLATLSELEFRFLSTPSQAGDAVAAWAPAQIDDFEFSLVFWEEEEGPEQRLDPPFFHLWLSTGEADVIGGSGVYSIPFRFPALARELEEWQMAVSYCSPVDVPSSVPVGLVLTTDMIRSDADNRRRVLAFLPGDMTTNLFGVKKTVKPVCQDTVGVPMRQLPLDTRAYFNVELRDAVTYEVRTDASHFVFCVTMYKA